MFSALLLLVPALFTAAPSTGTPERESLAFVGVNVLSMDSSGAVLEDQTVLVDAGRITALGARAELTPPEGARVVAAEGRWLLPGMAEMHGHLPSPNGAPGFAEDVLFLYLANGITSVRGMLGDPSQLELRDRIARGELSGPRLFVGSPPLHGGLGLTPESAAALVAEFATAGYDHLKVHEGLSAEAHRAIAAAATEHGLRFGGHVADDVGLWAALENGQATVDHLDNLIESLLPEGAQPATLAELAAQVERERMPEVAAKLARSGTALVPTQALWAHLLGGLAGDAQRERHPELKYMPRALVDGWVRDADQRAASMGDSAAPLLALRDEMLLALHEGGALIMMGTDSPQLFSVPGFSLHREIQAMAKAGLGAPAILDAGTAAVARFYGEDYQAGRVAPGLRADLILLTADPREDLGALARPEAVLADGRLWTREALDAGLARIAAAHAE